MSDNPALVVLTSLAEGDKYGYLIMRHIETFTQTQMSPRTLHGVIARLKEQGWIRPVGPKDLRQVYTITPLGRAHLKRNLSALQAIAKAGDARLKHASGNY